MELHHDQKTSNDTQDLSPHVRQPARAEQQKHVSRLDGRHAIPSRVHQRRPRARNHPRRQSAAQPHLDMDHATYHSKHDATPEHPILSMWKQPRRTRTPRTIRGTRFVESPTARWPEQKKKITLFQEPKKHSWKDFHTRQAPIRCRNPNSDIEENGCPVNSKMTPRQDIREEKEKTRARITLIDSPV